MLTTKSKNPTKVFSYDYWKTLKLTQGQKVAEEYRLSTTSRKKHSVHVSELKRKEGEKEVVDNNKVMEALNKTKDTPTLDSLEVEQMQVLYKDVFGVLPNRYKNDQEFLSKKLTEAEKDERLKEVVYNGLLELSKD